jgi:hypothetical protein
MAKIGLKNFLFGILTEQEDGTATYGVAQKPAKAISCQVDITNNDASLYADDSLAESDTSFQSGTVTLGIDDENDEMLAILLCHTITDGETVYIWYNSEKTVFTAPAGDITADHDQTIPTYEEILNLDASRIAAADYRDLEGLRCIYVETAESENGYALRYWVSVDSGLLVSSEKLYHGEVIYRMSALTLEPTAPVNSDFALPDGTQLISQ